MNEYVPGFSHMLLQLFVQQALAVARERFLNRRGAENIKYMFCFALKFAKNLHQPVISMGVGYYTSFSHLI